MGRLEELAACVRRGDQATAVQITQDAIGGDDSVDDILAALVGGMDEVGRLFKANDIFIPEVLIAARAMKESLAVLKPLLVKSGKEPAHTAVIGAVHGDLHDIGKNLVGMMWSGANFKVIDLGTNVTREQFVAAVEKYQPDIVGLSALLSTTMMGMKETIEAIRSCRVNTAKIVVGGAPVTQAFADEVGADGFASDAASAVDLARNLLAN